MVIGARRVSEGWIYDGKGGTTENESTHFVLFVPKILFLDVCGWCILIRCCDLGLSLSWRWVTIWAVVSVKASDVPGIVPAYGGFYVAVVHSVRLIIITAVFAGARLLRVRWSIIWSWWLFWFRPSVYSTRLLRSCGPFLHLDQRIVGLHKLCQSLYSGCPLSWRGEGKCLVFNLWLSRSSALHPWLRNPYRQSSRPCCPSYIYFLWGQRPLWWCFRVGQQSPLTFRHPTVVSPKLDLGAESLSSGCRGFL